LRESLCPSRNATNGLLKLTFQIVAGIRVARAEDRSTVLGVPLMVDSRAMWWQVVRNSRGPDLGVCDHVGDDDLHGT
jgi:hypothetical protein